MIVVDASAAVLGLLNDADARSMMAEETLAVPHLVDAEIAHTLRRHVIRAVISADAATDALRGWTGLGIMRFPVVGLLARVWELRENLSPYDASYVALAEQLECPLVTADARLGRAPGPRCPITVVPA